ncbi:outer membrane protein assembly factor BamE [Stakelama saccharophila]|uniref:Outer membrane protein assembly factor BamE n=1 Tax=Stakelama saccharophila TaxID=3075605 RepID=A0ABZ0BAA1_9SPHN|nr:outer membrane protein assembly factor BamE [Stakelama sp. W311]WNO54283.1 outer membrane protein assembly factor BamE [Stakelama sp. W311]
MSVLFKRVLFAAGLAAMAATGGCTKMRAHHGYVTDADLANSIQPGVDNRDSVRRVLGTPTLPSQYTASEWYYVGRDTRSLSYRNPKPVGQTTLRIRFDDKGVVKSIDRLGMEQVVSIDPSNKKTPTLGRKRGFFDQLFGNIGQVTPGGLGGGANPNNQNQ